jgi:1-acyl-sn-glycerol-3-phosphate acyltransferase
MKRLAGYLDYAWRVFGIRLCFFLFGVGALILGYTILPLLRLLTKDPEQKDLNAQHMVSLSFRFFVFVMESLGLIKFHFKGFEQLRPGEAHFMIANHPTLIDYVVMVSQLKNCYTLLKADASNNPFMKKVIQTTGYISNADPDKAYQQIQRLLKNGQNLLIFPEGTRTMAGKPMKLQRGAANIALRLNMPVRIVRINCLPRFLTKECRWYTVPHKKIQFSIEVGELVDIAPFMAGNLPPTIAARKLTDILTQKLEGTTDE